MMTRGESVSVNISDCTVTEKILLASHQLEVDGQSPFSAEALIVACWQKFPKTFGLKGYTDQYPDSNKVLSSIMGERGLARRGWLVKMGQKLYALTREGRNVANRLLHGGELVSPPAPSQRASKLSRDQEKALLLLFETTAVEKFDEARKPELTFTDACRFWGINENMHGAAVDERIEQARLNLKEVARLLNHGDADLSTGRSVSAEEVEHLVEVHDYLEERFARHLSLLRTRS
ncbi:MAG: hypothetical protein AB7K24_19275 [Gemmataceae bacterium]